MSVKQFQDEPIELTPRSPLQRVEQLQRMEIAEHEAGLRDFMRVLQKQKWTIAIWILVVLTAAALLSLRMTPIYNAIARISVSSDTPNYLKFKDNQGPEQGTSQVNIDTDVRIMQSDTLAAIVIRKLHLDTNPEFAGQQQEKTNGGVLIADSEADQTALQERLLAKFQNNLHIQTVAGTTMIEVGFTNPNSVLASQIANSITTSFIEQNIKAHYDSTIQAANLLSTQLADLQIQMEKSQAALVNYQKENGIVGVDEKQNLTTDKLADLSKELLTAQSDRIEKQSLLQTVAAADPNSLGATLQDPTLMALHQQQVEYRSQIARLSTELGPAHPRVIEVKNQLDEVQTSFDAAMQNAHRRILNDYQTALNREQLVQTALDAQTNVANQLNQNAIQYKVLKEEADANRDLYNGLLEKLKEASLAAGLNSSNIRVVDTARPPSHPSSPNIPRNMEIALLFGIIGGVATAFVLEGINVTVRTPDQSEKLCGLPTVGVIPQHLLDQAAFREASSQLAVFHSPVEMRPEFLVSYLKPLSEVVESYRALRTSVLLSAGKTPPKVILLTSAMPQDGKTTTSVNVAIVMAQQNKRVLLIDADLRRPTIYKAFGLRPGVGLSGVLTGISSVEEAIQPTIQPNLFVLPSGPLPPHPAELLGSSKMQDLLAQWRDQYDFIILDTPPVLSVTDAVMLSVLADAVILIIRAGKTTSAALRRAADLLLHIEINLLGVVVNAADLSSPDYHYYGSGYNSYYRDRKAPELGPRIEDINTGA